MRDTFRNRSSRLSRPSPVRSFTLLALLVVFAVTLILLDRSGRLEPFRSRAIGVVAPALGMLQRFGDQASGVGKGLSDVQQLRSRNAELEHTVSELQDEHLKYQALKLENEQLTKQLNIQRERPWKLLNVGVVAVTPDVGRHVMLIDKGTDDGVKVGMALIGQEGGSPTALVGVVEQAGPRNARVLLISDFSSEISAKVYHENVVSDGVVQGQFQRGAWLRLEEVDRSVPLKAGDQVMTAGLTAQMDLELPNSAIPRNIPIGVVERVWTEGYRQFAELRPYLAPDQVRYAWVILSHDG